MSEQSDEEMDMTELSMELISYAGEARSQYMAAIKAAKENDFEKADAIMAEAETNFIGARNAHIDSLAKCVRDNFTPDILLIHAQEHLTLAETTKSLAEEVIALRRELAEMKGQI